MKVNSLMRGRAEMAILGTLVLGLTAGVAGAADAKVAAAPVSDTEKWIQQSKNPITNFTWGADLRLRNEYVNNASTLNPRSRLEELDYFRFRARVWGSLQLVPQVTANIRMTVEPREYMMKNSDGKTIGWDWTEGIVDNLNLKFTDLVGLSGLTFTVGRQDIMLGESMNWWLVCDGTPLDGSRTMYFDAARLTYNIPDAKTVVDVIAITQFADNDAWLPPIAEQTHVLKQMTEQNEKGAIVYVANKCVAAANFDAFFMYKHDDYKIKNGDDADLYTFGGKLSGLPLENVKYYLQGAYQCGDRSGRTSTGTKLANQEVSAFGVDGKVSYLLKDKMDNQARLSFEYESGDDPDTQGTYEQFNTLWGRWPRWSEMYIYNAVNESRVADNSNLIRFGPGYSIAPIKNLTYSIDYYALFADQSYNNSSATASNASLFNKGGNFRGHLLQTILKYKFNQHLSGHLWGELLWPGDYYTARQENAFFRAEILLTY